MNRTLNQAVAASASRAIIGIRNVPGGRGRQQVASAAFDSPRALTIYSQCTPGPVPGSSRGAVGDFRDHRIKLFMRYGSGAFSATGEIPANKHFSVVAQEVAIFGEVWSQFPQDATQPDSSILFTSDPLQTVDCNVGIVEGSAGDASLPSVFVPSPVNRLATHAFYGQTLGQTGLISPLACVLQSISGFNGGPSDRYLHVIGPADRDRYPMIVIPVPANTTFNVDYSTTGGRPFPTGATWIASASPNLSTTAESTSDAALHVEAEVSFV